MAKVKPPVGTYNIQGNKFIPNQDGLPVFIKFTRKRDTDKPADYLMVGKYGRGETYFSSMYPTDQDGVYTLEHGGTYYTMTITGNVEASITLKKGK